MKFRVWDFINKKWFSQEVLGILSLKVFLASENIQQSTRLKDKNGREIYEGDILRYTNEYTNSEFIQYYCQVKFGEGSFDGGVYAYKGFYLQDGCGKRLEPYEITSLVKNDGNYEFEVAGNIFENLKLLEAEIKNLE